MLIGENQPIIQVMCVPLTAKANSPPLIFTHADLSNRQKPPIIHHAALTPNKRPKYRISWSERKKILVYLWTAKKPFRQTDKSSRKYHELCKCCASAK